MQKTVVGFQRSNKTTDRTDKVYYFRAVSSFQHLKESKKKEKRRLILGPSEVELYHELFLVDPEATISSMVFLTFAPFSRFFEG